MEEIFTFVKDIFLETTKNWDSFSPSTKIFVGVVGIGIMVLIVYWIKHSNDDKINRTTIKDNTNSPIFNSDFNGDYINGDKVMRDKIINNLPPEPEKEEFLISSKPADKVIPKFVGRKDEAKKIKKKLK